MNRQHLRRRYAVSRTPSRVTSWLGSSLLAVVTVGWCLSRAAALAELFRAGETPVPMWMFYWIRFGIPLIIVGVGVYWLLTQVFRIFAGV